MAELFDRTNVASPGHYNASQTALLLLDFHSMLVSKAGGPGAAPALKNAAKLRGWAKQQNVLVVHGLIDVDSPPVPTAKAHAMLASVAGMMKSSGSHIEPTDITENDSGPDREVHFTRPLGYVSALKSPDLEELLQRRGIKSLILCGISTSGCVLRTAVHATEKDYVVTAISNACADPDEEVHRVVLEKELLMTAFVCEAEEFIKRSE